MPLDNMMRRRKEESANDRDPPASLDVFRKLHLKVNLPISSVRKKDKHDKNAALAAPPSNISQPSLSPNATTFIQTFPVDVPLSAMALSASLGTNAHAALSSQAVDPLQLECPLRTTYPAVTERGHSVLPSLDNDDTIEFDEPSSTLSCPADPGSGRHLFGDKRPIQNFVAEMKQRKQRAIQHVHNRHLHHHNRRNHATHEGQPLLYSSSATNGLVIPHGDRGTGDDRHESRDTHRDGKDGHNHDRRDAQDLSELRDVGGFPIVNRRIRSGEKHVLPNLPMWLGKGSRFPWMQGGSNFAQVSNQSSSPAVSISAQMDSGFDGQVASSLLDQPSSSSSDPITRELRMARKFSAPLPMTDSSHVTSAQSRPEAIGDTEQQSGVSFSCLTTETKTSTSTKIGASQGRSLLGEFGTPGQFLHQPFLPRGIKGFGGGRNGLPKIGGKLSIFQNDPSAGNLHSTVNSLTGTRTGEVNTSAGAAIMAKTLTRRSFSLTSASQSALGKRAMPTDRATTTAVGTTGEVYGWPEGIWDRGQVSSRFRNRKIVIGKGAGQLLRRVRSWSSTDVHRASTTLLSPRLGREESEDEQHRWLSDQVRELHAQLFKAEQMVLQYQEKYSRSRQDTEKVLKQLGEVCGSLKQSQLLRHRNVVDMLSENQRLLGYVESNVDYVVSTMGSGRRRCPGLVGHFVGVLRMLGDNTMEVVFQLIRMTTRLLAAVKRVTW